MRYPHDNFPQGWSLTAGYGFGDKTSYGFHEALDVNDKGGGDSDLGKPIYAEADGVITSVHNHTTKPTFGNHYHLKCDGAWGTVWFHHAHCLEILVKEGDTVKEGQLIAKIGKSGTEYSHDHWACKLQPTGVDGIAKTKEDLVKWTDPVAFVDKWKNQGTQIPVPSTSLTQFDAIKRGYKALTGEWVKDEEVNPWVQKGISLDDTLAEVMKGDGRFYKLWIDPHVAEVEASYEKTFSEMESDLQKAQQDLKDYITQQELKADEIVEVTTKTYPTSPKNTDKKPEVSLEAPQVLADLFQFLKKKLGL